MLTRNLPGARGESAQVLQEAEGYRARVVNEAEGEASRFVAVYNEYAKASEVTRKRLYLETMERVLGGVEKNHHRRRGRAGCCAVPAAERAEKGDKLMSRSYIVIGAIVAIAFLALSSIYIG